MFIYSGKLCKWFTIVELNIIFILQAERTGKRSRRFHLFMVGKLTLDELPYLSFVFEIYCADSSWN